MEMHRAFGNSQQGYIRKLAPDRPGRGDPRMDPPIHGARAPEMMAHRGGGGYVGYRYDGMGLEMGMGGGDILVKNK